MWGFYFHLGVVFLLHASEAKLFSKQVVPNMASNAFANLIHLVKALDVCTILIYASSENIQVSYIYGAPREADFAV
eukprot:UN22714